jgi:hypothetical protein
LTSPLRRALRTLAQDCLSAPYTTCSACMRMCTCLGGSSTARQRPAVCMPLDC